MLIIDRFEGEYAVCEDPETRTTQNIPKVFLPEGAGEGTCLLEQPDGSYRIDYAETLRRREEAQRRLHNLFS